MDKILDDIYKNYAKELYRYIFNLCRNETLAEDIMQETMLNAVMSIDKFKGECSLKTYLCRIARNIWLNYAKRAENKNIPIDDSLEFAADDSVEEQLNNKMQSQAIHRVLHTLEEPYKEVFTLRVFAELKFNDIGNLFGESANWARVTFFRAKEKIIRQLEKENEI
ncbi:MAG: sigma-70 family RNA polymerase sigma factor [Ruminococcus sp.]|nr:sigma-70 family RNA polymerase sigma factor [Ruminococcus sp.]MBQ9139059.1 sigma-70 family RNA polymerase sigma factor [Ruminococcus sp.]